MGANDRACKRRTERDWKKPERDEEEGRTSHGRRNIRRKQSNKS